MVRKAACFMGIIMMSFLGAAAQEDISKVDVFGGYAYFDRAHGLGAVNLNGWEAQGTYNFNRWLGATADFGGYYARPGPSIDFNEYTFLFGPTVSLRTPHITPFADALFGVSHLYDGAFPNAPSHTPFTFALGGGVDVPVKGRLVIRAIQLDWIRANYAYTPDNILRVSTGLVFRLGSSGR
jgi:hypothetical protein